MFFLAFPGSDRGWRLGADQAKLLLESNDSIEIVDAEGNRLGFVARPFSAEDIAIARQRADSREPRRTTQQVLERIGSLEQK